MNDSALTRKINRRKRRRNGSVDNRRVSHGKGASITADADSLKRENRRFIDAFAKAKGQVVLIEDFEKTLAELTDR